MHLSRKIPQTLCVLALLATPANALAGHPSDFVGIDSQDTFESAYNNELPEMASNLRAQKSTGIKLHRQPFSWQLLEPRKGRFDLTITDRYMAQMAERGMKVLPVLFNAPRFYEKKRDRPGMFSQPKSGKALGKFARTLVTRYGPKGTFWTGSMRKYRKRAAVRALQYWNEPNLRQYWGGKPNAKQYVRMVLAARKEMRKARGGKSVEVVTAGIPQSSIRGAVSLKKYIPAMYKAGLRRIPHTLGFNAYANNTKDLHNKLKSVRKYMKKGGAGKRKIWITEIGWASGGKKHRLRKGRRGQAREITKAVKLIGQQRKKLKLRGFVYYNWRDARPYRSGISADTWGFHAGLLELDGDSKPARKAFRKAVRRLR